MKKISIKLVAIMIVLIMMLSTICFATSSSELKNQQKEINGQIKEKKEELEEVKEEKSETMQEVESLSDKIDTYQEQIEELSDKVDELNNSISENEKKLAEAQENYNKQEELLNQRLVSLYEAGDTTYLDVLLSSNDFTDLISNWFLVSELASYDTDMLEKIENQKKQIEETKNNLENNKKDLQTTKSSKEAKTVELKEAKEEKNKKVAQLSESEKIIQEEIDELKSHESSISSKIKKMQEEYDRQHSNSGNKNNSSNTGGSGNSSSSYGFGWPVSNHTIGTEYGVSGPYWSSGYHTGIDFEVSSGTPVYSIGDGQVFDTGYSKAYGNFVEIYHGNNIYSYYAHASSVQVSIGQNVSKGQQIMLSGKTGNVTGAHLHFEIRTPGYKYAYCVNPRPYLP